MRVRTPERPAGPRRTTTPAARRAPRRWRARGPVAGTNTADTPRPPPAGVLAPDAPRPRDRQVTLLSFRPQRRVRALRPRVRAERVAGAGRRTGRRAAAGSAWRSPGGPGTPPSPPARSWRLFVPGPR